MFPVAMNWDNTAVTLELNDLLESGCKPWAFDYPSYYEGEAKKAFEQKVLDHYRFRQIGQETPGRWLHYFRTRIREIMPYYIQLYESQVLMQGIDDPFGNVDIVETFEETRSGTLDRKTTGSLSRETTGSLNRESSSTQEGETESNSSVTTTDTESSTDTLTGNHVKKFANTPQNSLDNLDNYLTEATVETENNTTNHEKTGNGSSQTTATGTQLDTATATQTDTESGSLTDTESGSVLDTESGTVQHTYTKKGNQGVNTYAHDMKELRETFLNIDMMIINELNDLFLMVY